MLLNTLVQIGMEEKQAKIYLACLELGETSIKDIAKKSGIKRTTIYDLIDVMINSGFIKTTTRGKRKKFIAAEPDELQIILKKRESLLEQIMPVLSSINNSGNLKPKVWFYEGVEGLKIAYDDTLRYPNTTMYQWASSDMFNAVELEWLMDYIKRRVKKNIRAHTIVSDSPEMREFKKRDKEELREIKIISPNLYPFKIEMDVYGNRVAMISARDKVGIIIESEPIVQTLKMIFKLCWDNLK